MAEPRPEPWASGYRSYAGWVPNVRSHLSFSLIGAASGARSFTQPTFDGPTRIVLVLQKRTVNDYPYWEWLARFLFPDITAHWFIDAETAATEIPIRKEEHLDTEVDRQGMLGGSVLLLPRQHSRARQRHVRSSLDRVADLLATHRNLRTGEEVRDLRARVVDIIEQAGSYITIRFAVMRTGECRIWFDAEVPGLGLADHDRIAEQAYYFLKDVVHHHTHHDPSSDQITPLVRFDPASSEPGHEDEVAWRRETLWSLSREVERLNRDGGLVGQRRALGIIAYAEAFQASLMSHVRDAKAPKGFRENTTVHDFDFKHLKDSVKASIDVEATKTTQRVQLSIAAVTLTVSSMALVSSIVGTHNAALPRTQSGEVIGAVSLGLVGDFLLLAGGQPLVVGLVVVLVLLGFIGFFLADGGAGLYNAPQRIISQLARAASVSLVGSPRWQRVCAMALQGMAGLSALGMSLLLLWVIAEGGGW